MALVGLVCQSYFREKGKRANAIKPKRYEALKRPNQRKSKTETIQMHMDKLLATLPAVTAIMKTCDEINP